MRLWMGMAVVAGMLLSGSIARADADLALPGGTLLASMTTSGSIVGGVKAKVESWVFDPGALGGNDLIFAWQVTMAAGSVAVHRVTAGLEATWAPWALATHHTSGPEASFFGSVLGTQAPNVFPFPFIGEHGVDLLGGYPFFNFNPLGYNPGGELAATEVSYILGVATKAPNFTLGTINIIDGSTLTLKSFAPAVPEPATLLLLGTGLLGLGGAARKKLKGKKNANQ